MGTPPRFYDLPEPLRERTSGVVDVALEQALRRAADFEFTTFRLAARGLPELAEADPEWQDHVRAVMRVEFRARLEVAWPERRFDALQADMIVEIRPREVGAAIWFDPQPAYVAGRYRKLARGLSQTAMFCHRCRGRARRRGRECAACDGSGRAVGESVEDFVRPAIRTALGAASATFHGSGREDVDVRMLGSGRPFAVSLESPRRRSLEGAVVAADVVRRSAGRVEVSGLSVVSRDELRRLTTEHGQKTYRAVVRPVGGGALPDDAVARIVALRGVTLDQRTPQRVGRRADCVRRRTVCDLDVETAGPDEMVLRLETDPGLYVKEFVSGDEGRTLPSVSEALGVPCECAELDVLGVGD